MAVTAAPPLGYINFVGAGWGTTPGSPGPTHPVQVLCGDNPPTITDGYAIWQTIQRPLIRGVTIFQGYNPTLMTIDLRFGKWTTGGWNTSQQAGTDTEDDIKWIGWMAGEGFLTGQSPVVYVTASALPGGDDRDLIPARWSGPNVPWVISALTWGTSYRNAKNGKRIWQEATITLMQFLSVSQNPPSATIPARGSDFTTTAAIRTALAIANSVSKLSPQAYRENLAHRICSAAQNSKIFPRGGRSSINQKISIGTKVYVPEHTN